MATNVSISLTGDCRSILCTDIKPAPVTSFEFEYAHEIAGGRSDGSGVGRCFHAWSLTGLRV